jgi:hypothetical protein
VEEEIPFIYCQQTHSLFAAMDRTAKSRSIMTIGAYYGYGLSRLLRQWVIVEPKSVQDNQVALVQLMNPELASFRNIKIMTPPALLLLWETCYVLRDLLKVQRGYDRTSSPPRTGSEYSESYFLRLNEELRRLAQKLQLRALVIDNAQFLDERGLRKLVEVRDRCEHKFGLILCYQMRDHAQPHERIQPLLEKVHVLDQRTDAEVVEQMSEAEFRSEVLPRLYIALEADFSLEIEAKIGDFEATLWKHTKGNWHRIEALTTIFDEELGPKDGDVRIINLEVEERINQRLNKTKRQ